MKTVLKTQLFFFAVLLLLVSCGGGGGVGGSASTGGTGALSVSLTDSSGCGFDNVFVTIRKIRVHKSSSANDSDGGWVDITPQGAPLKVDLLTLQNGVTTGLGVSPLSAGHYTQVRLYLEKNTGAKLNNYVVVGGVSHAIFVPSGFQTGIKIIHEFDVTDGVTEDLVLDFDPCRSIVRSGNGTYHLKPVITAVLMKIAGSITGAVSELSSDAVVKAEIGGVVIKQTMIKPDGSFMLGPLPDSDTVKVLYPQDTNGTYDVVVVSEKTNTAVTTDVPVTKGQQTVISTTTNPTPIMLSPAGVLDGNMNPTSADARVRQTVNGKPYQIARDSSNLVDGSFSFILSVAPPVFAQYSATLPLGYQSDTGTAANYTVDTPNDAGLYDVSSQTVTVSSSAPVHVDFTGVNSLTPASGAPGTVQGAVTVANLPAGFSSGTIVLSAMTNNENVNSIGIPVSSTGTFSYTIDDLAPGTYTVTVLSAAGFGSLSPDLQVVVPSTGGTFTGKDFTVAP